MNHTQLLAKALAAAAEGRHTDANNLIDLLTANQRMACLDIIEPLGYMLSAVPPKPLPTPRPLTWPFTQHIDENYDNWRSQAPVPRPMRTGYL